MLSISVSVLLAVLACSPPTAAVIIESVEGESSTPIRALPCAPIFVPLRVSVRGDSSRATIQDALNRLAAHTTIDGESYLNELANLEANEVLGLIEDPSFKPQPPPPSNRTTFRAVAQLFWNFKENDCTFPGKGVHTVGLEPYYEFQVVVDDVSSNDFEVVRAIRNAPSCVTEILLGLRSSKDRDAGAYIEALMARFPESAYRDMLSVSLGLRKVADVLPDPEKGIAQYFVDRDALERRYFVPAFEDGIQSLHEAVAAYTYVHDLLAREKLMPGQEAGHSQSALLEAKSLLAKLRESAVSLDFAEKCAKDIERFQRK
ncbi:MAG: hypothetical protein J5J06_13430 [Phycisphaerae bacterium]|nr:hypothetical protein [Phycisphaerae bacterium]